MGGVLVVVGSNVPVGYTVPQFPSLHFPIGSTEYELSFLYFTYDIWRFTVFWTLILFEAFHLASAAVAAVVHGKVIGGLWIILVYGIIAGVEAFVSGSVTGLMLAAIYRAGIFGMTTWMPFIWGIIQVLYMVISSYSNMSAIL